MVREIELKHLGPSWGDWMMQPTTTRREFLGQAAALGLGCFAGHALAAESGATAESPGMRVTIRDAHLKATGMPDSWSALRSIGAEGMEAIIDDHLALPQVYHPEETYSAATAADRRLLKDRMEATGRRITAFCMFNRFEERPEFEVEWCQKTAECARDLNVAAIRIDVVPRKMEPAAFLEHAIAVLKQVIAATEATGARFAIENHGRLTNDPDFLAPLLDGVGSERLGLTLDTANFYWFGHPLSRLYEIYEQFAPRSFHTHCKSIRYPEEQREQQRPMGWRYADFHAPIYEGDIDFQRVVAILRKVGYRDDLCIESASYRGLPAPEVIAMFSKEIEMLKSLR
jgi:sugar phosphate isomerase/epimerase